MLYWVFDLDATLYKVDDSLIFTYSLLNRDLQLNYLLSILPCKKIIFSNGTKGHVLTTIKKLEIEDIFERSNIYGRDTLNDLKPNVSAFNKLIKRVDIKTNDKVVFFEDNVDNLITAKNFNWITVLVSERKVLIPEIDFWFPNIHVALNYFNSKISMKK
jgi:FMN phosphatase YigB (HAD superfamily)